MRRAIALSTVAVVWILALWITGVAARTSLQVVTRERDGYVPATTVIKRNVPGEAQLCAERLDSDFVDCQPIGEVRKWLHGRAVALK